MIKSLNEVVVLLFVSIFSISVWAEGFCDDYVICMQKLEVKQRDCLLIEENVKLRSSDSCTRDKWKQKLQLNGLHMRRAELARDCVTKNLKDASLSESTLDTETNNKCQSLHRKFPAAKMGSSRKKRSLGKRAKRFAKRTGKATECRRSTKAWHKHCSSLAKCCPLAQDCKVATKEIMDQIQMERRKLRDLKEACERV